MRKDSRCYKKMDLYEKESKEMKKRIIIAMALVASLAVVAPITNVKAAEIEITLYNEESLTQESIATYADVIQRKYRMYNNKVQYRRWNATRGYWVDEDWIDL